MSVSVIIPTYNRANLVIEAIDSVFNQTYKDVEIIVIDDGSTDNTREVLRKYGNRIKYIYQNNQGLNSARNNALEHASGDYIAFLDSDDLWLDFKLDLQLSIFKNHPNIGFVFSDFFIFSDNGKRSPKGLQSWPDIPSEWSEIFNESTITHDIFSQSRSRSNNYPIKIYFGDIYKASLYGPIVLPSTALIKHSFIKNGMRFIEHASLCGTDWEFFARLSRSSSAAFIDHETTLNRSHEDEVRLTRVDPAKRINMRLDMIKNTWESNNEFSENNQDSISLVKRRYYLKLLKLSLLNNNTNSARESIGAIKRINNGIFDIKLILLTLLSYMPGRHLIIKLIKMLR